jgi:hypothetical protein
MDTFKLRLDDRSPDEWLAEAEKYQQMARRFRHNSELSKTFNALAADACQRAGNPGLMSAMGRKRTQGRRP